ncbi:hypothetical protein BDR06DRAFT_1008648 [Suillus hirtellus]|nr:hypothetical protein BDR06DRAFT_1008648 [Suillus hirtellus]
MECVGETPLQNHASFTIAVANTPSRQKEKCKQPEIIENRLFADHVTDIYIYPCTNALLSPSQPLPSGKDTGYDSDLEEEYANFMPSLDISDESQWKPMPIYMIPTHSPLFGFMFQCQC